MPWGVILQPNSNGESTIGWIAAIIIGGIAGWLGEQFMKSQMGLLMNIVLGVIGAAVASWLLSFLHSRFRRQFPAHGDQPISAECRGIETARGDFNILRGEDRTGWLGQQDSNPRISIDRLLGRNSELQGGTMTGWRAITWPLFAYPPSVRLQPADIARWLMRDRNFHQEATAGQNSCDR